jgi:hypothetical protein
MSLASRVARLEQRRPAAERSGPYPVRTVDAAWLAGFAALFEEWDREHPAHEVVRLQTVAETRGADERT